MPSTPVVLPGQPARLRVEPAGDPARLLADVEWSEDHVDHRFEHLRGAFYSWGGRR
ncbi:hypothetical protein HD597_003952 [Nonomuraea thailandensis]|uniref:Uncharacterized protein n=1 Tax=Nonomuraea thailandensis TaxID=1188745 RepID=A0A9X2K156_9ACTN|nr:hypothetical protein [Nonomuraea thailandensis]MCP2356932.1 hypothetical protein [Nonomuraea thailandensis]